MEPSTSTTFHYHHIWSRKSVGDGGVSLWIVVEEDEKKAFEVKPYLDRMAQYVQNLFKYRNFFDQIEFTTSQSLVITELTNSMGGSNFVQILHVRNKIQWQCNGFLLEKQAMFA